MPERPAYCRTAHLRRVGANHVNALIASGKALLEDALHPLAEPAARLRHRTRHQISERRPRRRVAPLHLERSVPELAYVMIEQALANAQRARFTDFARQSRLHASERRISGHDDEQIAIHIEAWQWSSESSSRRGSCR